MQKYRLSHIVLVLSFLTCGSAFAQSLGRAGTLTGTVTDPSSAVVAGAKVLIQNRVTGYERTTTTDASGTFRFNDVPQNNYHLEVSVGGFQNIQQDVPVRTSVPINLSLGLKLASEATTIEVHSDTTDLVESVPTAHTDLDSSVFSKLPLSSTGSGISDAITLASPGVVADSNGFFHPLGDHAETGFSFDNQPVTDQQSKQFSTSMPVNAIQSMEV
ncbi:MAG: carboxypeptidase-like regulatory domain-containing protein, partial [Acidobacteriota bacterium]|nr:carboxypeptidase-like regulatory domain-containing protein [Acidobacteriota bacterium]